MRNTFARIINKITKKNKKIILLSGDIGNKLFDNFKKEHPNNFYNCGVAESNMTTVAAGLAFANEMKLLISKLFPYSLANSKFANIGRTAPKIDRKR